MTRRAGCAASCGSALAALAAALGCVGPPPMSRDWVRMEIAHYEVVSAVPEERTRELTRELELFRSVVGGLTTLGGADPATRTRIFVIDDRSWPHLESPRLAGAFYAGTRQNLITLRASSEALARETLYHEYVHFLMNEQDWAHYPLWLSEGWAELLSTFRIEGDWIYIAELPLDRVPPVVVLTTGDRARARKLSRDPAKLRRFALGVDVPALLGAREYPADAGRFYWGSLVLLHYLQLGRDSSDRFGEQMARYLAALSAGTDPGMAFSEAFGASPQEMSREVDAYLERPGLPRYRLPASHFAHQAPAFGPVETLATAETATELGELLLVRGEPSAAERYFDYAVRLSFDSARAHCGLGEALGRRRRWEHAASHLARCVSLSPDSAIAHVDRASLLLARAEAEPEHRAELLAEARAGLERSLALAPDLPEAHLRLGESHLLDPGDPLRAVAALERARMLLPAQLGVRLQLARAYARAGRRDEARALLGRVNAFAHPGPLLEAARGLLEELEAAPAAEGEEGASQKAK